MFIDIDRDTIIGDILRADRFSARVLEEFGMHCFGCGHVLHETLEQACETHGVNCDELVAQLTEWFAEREDSDC